MSGLTDGELQDALAKLGCTLVEVNLSPEETLRIEGWRRGIEEHGQDLWRIYHWIVHIQHGHMHGIYRLRHWLEDFSVPDNTNMEHWKT